MNVLIAYVSRSGSTREMAERMAETLRRRGLLVDVRPAAEVTTLKGYDAVIAGGLLYRLGWHPDVLRFLRAYKKELSQKRVALFVSGLRLVPTGYAPDVPLFVDPAIVKQPSKPGRPSLVESFSTQQRYLGSTMSLIRSLRPVSLAFFAGELQMFRLNLMEKLIFLGIMLVTGIQPGNKRNDAALDEWSGNLADAFAAA